MGFLDFLQSVATGQTPADPAQQGVAKQVVQRLAQNTQATASGQFAGHDVGNIPLLGGILTAGGRNNGLSPLNYLNTAGTVMEGAGQVADTAAGAGLAATGLASRTGLLHTTRTNQDLLSAILGTASQGGGSPLQQARAANAGALQSVPGFGLVDAATNPLNFVGPVGEAGTALRGAEGAPALLRALGGALEGTSLTGKAALLPYEAGFNAIGRGVSPLIQGVKNAVAPAAKGAIPALAAAVDSGAASVPAALAPTTPSAPTFARATMTAIAKSGIDPAKLAGLDDDLARYVAENAGAGQEDGLIAAIRGTMAPEAAPAASAAATPAIAPSTAVTPPATGPQWTHYGPETIHPGEGVTPDLLDQFAKLRQFPNPSPLDIESEIGAMRDPVTLLQDTYGKDWQNRLAALTGGKWGQPGSGAQLANGRIMLGDLDLTTAVRDYLENRGGAQAGDFKGALKALLPEQGAQAPATALPSLSAPQARTTGTLDDLRALIASGDGGKMGGYAPSDLAFYQKRLGIAAGDVPQMLDQLVQEGTLGRLPDGSLGIKPTPKAAPALGGDLAAGGGGFGLIAPRLGPTLAGAAGGGLLGAGIGAATDSQDRLRGAAGGGLLGASVGGSLGAVTPDLLPGIQRDLTGPLGAVAREGLAAQKQAIATGEKNPIPSLTKMLPYIRSIKKTSALTLPRNLIGALSTTAIGEGNVPEAAANMRDIWRNLPTLLPALRAAGNDVAARDQALLSALPPRMQAYDAAGMRGLIEQAGVNYERNPTDLGAANVHPLAGAARGAGLAIATPKTLVMGPASLALGALEGASLPFRSAAQNALLTPIDQGARMAFAFPEYAKALADAAPDFLARVKATGQDIATLGADGSFGATDIADPALSTAWRALQQQAAQTGGALAKDRLGNFSDPGVSTGIVNALFPGGSWNVEQTKVLAKAAARHPQAALGILGAIEQDYQRHVNEGDPQHAGTWRLTDKTPGLGALVRLANGGAAGDLYLNPAYPISPLSGEVLNLPRELSPQYAPGMKPYDKAKTIAGVLGLGVNPEIDLGAYKAGQSATEPSSQVRLAPVGAFADALLHRAGAPLWENPIGQALTPDALQQPDLQQQIQYGRYVDPAAIRAGNEMIYELRRTSSSDPKNEDLVAQLRDPSSDFYQAALVRGLGGAAATSALGDVVPGSPQAQSATAHGGATAKFALLQQGLPITKAQVQEIAARPDGGVLLSQLRQAQIDAAKLQNPLLAVQDVSSPQALGQKVFDQWKRENAGLSLFPLVYGLQAQREQERLGLVPLGTAMGQQQQYDQLASGQSYGQPQPYPGVNPFPFDPTPLYDLMHYLNGGR